MNQHINQVALRVMLDYLYDGHFQTHSILLQIRHNYKRFWQVYSWLAKNKIRGAKLVEFFADARGDVNGQGVLQGVTKILNKVDGRHFHGEKLTGAELK